VSLHGRRRDEDRNVGAELRDVHIGRARVQPMRHGPAAGRFRTPIRKTRTLNCGPTTAPPARSRRVIWSGFSARHAENADRPGAAFQRASAQRHCDPASPSGLRRGMAKRLVRRSSKSEGGSNPARAGRRAQKKSILGGALRARLDCFVAYRRAGARRSSNGYGLLAMTAGADLSSL
jgi:hypothetical protein